MAIENVICLVVDRLHAGFLGAYGNTWIHTPAIDRLAAESFVFDRAMIDTPDLALQYRSLWNGKHVLCPSRSDTPRKSFIAQLVDANWPTTLLTDAPNLAAVPDAAKFDECSVINSAKADLTSPRDAPAEAIDETDAGRFFAAAIDWISSARDHFFLWLHTGTLGRLWDAPLEYRRQYADEDDPSPSQSTSVPNRTLPEHYDPDELLNFNHAYAGQITLIDELIAAFLQSAAERGWDENTLIVFYAPRGFPMGEHRRVGPCDEPLYAELIHVPLMLRFPAAMDLMSRSQSIVMPADVPSTILDACGFPVSGPSAGCGRSLMPLMRGEATQALDRAVCIGPQNQHAVATPAWSLRASEKVGAHPDEGNASTSEANCRLELFAKPDDWHEINDVSDRCPEIAEKMQAEFEAFSQACQTEEPVELRPLPEELVIGYC